MTIFVSGCCIIPTLSWNYALESISKRQQCKMKWYSHNHATNMSTPPTPALSKLYQEGDSSHIRICQRITSKQASKLIERTYNSSSINSNNKKGECNDKNSSLLLITSDASRGANRHSGLTSVIRLINSYKENDEITVAARRVNSMDARDIFQSEVAALALGMKTAMQCIPNAQRKRVLLLTDSNSALTFFCGDEENVKSPTYDHSQYRFMQNLLDETDQVYMAKVKSAKSGSDGFFDHDVTDVISSFMKNVSNKRLEMYFQERQSSKDELLYGNTKRSHAVYTASCACLSKRDLDYLYNSSVAMEDKTSTGKNHFTLKRESGERIRRCRNRIRIDLGIDLDDERLNS